MKSPTIYKEWVECFQLLKDSCNDNEVLEAMKQGEIEWQSGIAERFTKQLFDVVNHRLVFATDKFQKSQANGSGNEGRYIQALLALRKELQNIEKVVTIPVIPEKEQQRFKELVREHTDRIQKSLEDSAKSDYSGKMSSIVKNHKVN
ncbi:hypothetical protein BCR22_11230 [Enterococcus plantarum]|uniref:hypothetical protein n=1 Tax=Enterococcus plantarum TaxID=1077675 RepID=UPI00084D86A1|nr:hypothetical protein [Enterococcus plantarum]OEG18218.1 hypothetical protein BCR22_11230 [Enterococcus plantarum]